MLPFFATVLPSINRILIIYMLFFYTNLESYIQYIQYNLTYIQYIQYNLTYIQYIKNAYTNNL